jgi:hypothetical protein
MMLLKWFLKEKKMSLECPDTVQIHSITALISAGVGEATKVLNCS